MVWALRAAVRAVPPAVRAVPPAVTAVPLAVTAVPPAVRAVGAGVGGRSRRAAATVDPMDLAEALRTTGAVRAFTPDPVPDGVTARVLDTARFAPNGGNRQAWRVVVVKDPAVRRSLRDLYLPGWYEYLAMSGAGLTPWAPVTDREAEARAAVRAPELAATSAAGPGGFAEHLDAVPVLLVVFADLRRLAAVDRDAPGYTMVGGASIYPFVWSILLAARAEGLGGVLTTMVVRRESEVRRLLHAPPDLSVAAMVALGWPERRPTRLVRAPVNAFATVDRCDGPPVAAPTGVVGSERVG